LIDYDTQNLTTTVRYQYTNHLDSASLELDETGAIITYEEYHPFGTTSYRSGRSDTEVKLKRYKYVHKELDNETGLYYYGMRYYAPWIARFISVDPLQFKYPELTPFQYASNAPISNIDLDGAEAFNKTLADSPNFKSSIWANSSLSFSYIFGNKKTSHFNFGFSTSVGAITTFGKFSTQASFNFSLMVTNGGLTTPFGERNKVRSELISSPGLNIGFGDTSFPVKTNYLHGNATTSLYNPVPYSLTYTWNKHFTSDGRNQTTATYGLRFKYVSLNVLEDNKAWLGADTKDRYWTGSGNFNVHLKNGTNYTFATDTYTGESINTGRDRFDWGDNEIGGTVKHTPNKGKDFYWANQFQMDEKMGLPKGFNQSLNNAQTYFQMSSFNGIFIRISSIGPFNFWSQNYIHDFSNFHHFKPSVNENSIQSVYGISTDF